MGGNVVKADKCMGVPDFGGARARAAPKICAYGYMYFNYSHLQNLKNFIMNKINYYVHVVIHVYGHKSCKCLAFFLNF